MLYSTHTSVFKNNINKNKKILFHYKKMYQIFNTTGHIIMI